MKYEPSYPITTQGIDMPKLTFSITDASAILLNDKNEEVCSYHITGIEMSIDLDKLADEILELIGD